MEFSRNERKAAMNYCIYMMASSYFRSSKCLNESREFKNYLLYRLCGINEQYRMEDTVIALMEKTVLKILPEPFLTADVKVDFLTGNEGVHISALGYQLDIRPVEDERKILLSYEYRDLMDGTVVRYAPEIKKKRRPR